MQTILSNFNAFLMQTFQIYPIFSNNTASYLKKNFFFGNKVHLSINFTTAVFLLLLFYAFRRHSTALFKLYFYLHIFVFSDFQLLPDEPTQAKQSVGPNKNKINVTFKNFVV